MSNVKIDVATLALDQDGRVMLSDDFLDDIEAGEEVSAGGLNTNCSGTTNQSCTNVTCLWSSNGNCSNAVVCDYAHNNIHCAVVRDVSGE